MKNIVLCFFLFLCLFGAGALATNSGAGDAGEGKAEGVDNVAENDVIPKGTPTPFSFGLKNRRGDSAWCTIEYTPRSGPSTKKAVRAELKKGVDARRDVFEDAAFEKIIDRMQQGRKFDNFKGVRMSDCRLCVTGSVESNANQDSDEKASSSFTPNEVDASPPVKNAKNASAPKVEWADNGAGAVEKEVSDLKAYGDGDRDVSFPIGIKELLIISLIVNVALIFTIIIRYLRGKNSQEQMDFCDGKDSQAVVDVKEARIKELEEKEEMQTIKYAELAAENNRLREIVVSLGRGDLLVGADTRYPTAQFVAPPPAAAPLPSPPPQPQPQPETRKEIFYFSTPNRNSFDASKSTIDYVDGKSLYRFERVEGDNTATVFVEEKPKVVIRFIQSSEYQMGVCDFLGGYKKDATKIVTEEPGSAVLDDDGKWTVKKKIKIRYS